MLSQWVKDGKPKSIRLVELGPGRGTLMADMLRVSFTTVWLHQRSLTSFNADYIPVDSSWDGDRHTFGGKLACYAGNAKGIARASNN